MSQIQGVLIDLDGVMYNDSRAIPGASQTIHWLEEKNIPYRFITNTTMKSRRTLHEKLKNFGISVRENKIFSAAYAASLFVRQKKNATCFLLLLDDAKKEFQGLEKNEGEVDYVVAGDLGDNFTYELLNTAFLKLHNGARLIATQKNRFWLSDQGFKLDAGPFAVLLEYAADTESILIGKPAETFFKMALMDLNLPAENVMMIGDDIESDIIGANRLGISTCLVQTGKYRSEDLLKSKVKPDYLLPSIKFLPKLEVF